ncbi:transposase-associated domain-containing protein [Artemisia annua]|uniref:Transposase-associated domain-containing protein n=1 Tax=Artemisia annua TaxID=35608 RepID=A0A2U1LMJ1_ARTAN|nr:transposase-associated domain-containing protein [Artemisia annua]
MDRSWMYFAPRASPQYVEGVEYFLDFAFEKTSNNGKILCPCIDCHNMSFLTRDKVYDHLICSGFKKDYSNWKEHGEVCKASSSKMMSEEEGIFSHDIDGLLGDLFLSAPLESGVDMGESEINVGPTNILIREHKSIIKGQNRKRRLPEFELEKIHCEKFSEWFQKREVEQPVGSSTQATGSTTQAADTSSQQSHIAAVEQPSQQAPRKKARGPTKKKEIWNLKTHEQVVVTVNRLGQPIGDEANELTNFLGTLWRKVPENKKEDLWSIVKEKFIFEPESVEIKDWIMTDMSKYSRVIEDILIISGKVESVEVEENAKGGSSSPKDVRVPAGYRNERNADCTSQSVGDHNDSCEYSNGNALQPEDDQEDEDPLKAELKQLRLEEDNFIKSHKENCSRRGLVYNIIMVGVVVCANEREAAGCSGLHENHRRKLSTAQDTTDSCKKDDCYKLGFNPEFGSVGMPVAATIRAIMPQEEWEIPLFNKLPSGYIQEVPNTIWTYHKYIQ